MMRCRGSCEVPLGLLVLFLFFAITGCSSFKVGVPQWSGSGFLREGFLEYKSVAILPFDGDNSGEVSDAFAESFGERFPRISIINRKRVLEVFHGQTLNLSRLEDATRRKIGKKLGAEALVMGSVYYPSIVRWFLQVGIFDTETGRVIGRSLVEIDFLGAEGKKEGARFAVEKLTLW
jgi:hypothetical protein